MSNKLVNALRKFADSMEVGWSMVGEQWFGTYFSDYDGKLPRAACGIGCVIVGRGNFPEYGKGSGEGVRGNLVFDGYDLNPVVMPQQAIDEAEIFTMHGYPEYPTVFSLVTYMNDTVKLTIPEIVGKLRLMADAVEKMEV